MTLLSPESDLNELSSFLRDLATADATGENPFEYFKDDLEKIIKVIGSIDQILTEYYNIALTLDASSAKIIEESYIRSDYISSLYLLKTRLEVAQSVKIRRSSRAQRYGSALETDTALVFFNYIVRSIMGISLIINRSPRFQISGINIEQLIGLTDRLRSITASLYERVLTLKYGDKFELHDDISINMLKSLISEARVGIEKSSVGEPFRKLLNKYISQAELELSTDRPTWTRIIGALVIVSTLLSGVADLEEAYTNIRRAISYILQPNDQINNRQKQLPIWPDMEEA